jgi:hypothetical protein
MEPWGGAPAFHPGGGQWSGDTCTTWGRTRLDSHLRVENGLVELSPNPHEPERIFIARTLVQDHREVLVRVLNATRCHQKLMKGFPWHTVSQSHWLPLPKMNHRSKKLPRSCRTWLLQPGQTWVTLNPKSCKSSSPSMESDGYEWTIGVYHSKDTGETRPFHQPPKRSPLAKQADVDEMLEDI